MPSNPSQVEIETANKLYKYFEKQITSQIEENYTLTTCEDDYNSDFDCDITDNDESSECDESDDQKDNSSKAANININFERAKEIIDYKLILMKEEHRDVPGLQYPKDLMNWIKLIRAIVVNS